jgi:hypothetical protein
MDIIQVSALIGVTILVGVMGSLLALQFLEDCITDWRKWKQQRKGADKTEYDLPF